MAFFIFMEIRELKNITSKNILVDILLKNDYRAEKSRFFVLSDITGGHCEVNH